MKKGMRNRDMLRIREEDHGENISMLSDYEKEYCDFLLDGLRMERGVGIGDLIYIRTTMRQGSEQYDGDVRVFLGFSLFKTGLENAKRVLSLNTLSVSDGIRYRFLCWGNFSNLYKKILTGRYSCDDLEDPDIGSSYVLGASVLDEDCSKITLCKRYGKELDMELLKMYIKKAT